MHASNSPKMNYEMLSEAKSRKAGSFNQYLKKLQLSTKSIETYQAGVGLFLNWMKDQSIEPAQGSYTDILAYAKYCQKNGVAQRTIQHYLIAIKHFYNYLLGEKHIEVNPVTGIKMQGIKRKSLYHIFKPEELHAIYNSYQDGSLKGKRNKIILSLMVYQGVRTEELAKLKVQDIKLKEGKIEIPGGVRSEGRILKLESHQVMEFYEYINNIRKEILTKSAQQTDKLFVSMAGGNSFDGCMHRLIYWLKKKNKLVVNANQLRASVIVKWLKMYNLRQVQYLAGHRYISATESYQQNEMEGLTEEVNQFHPLG